MFLFVYKFLYFYFTAHFNFFHFVFYAFFLYPNVIATVYNAIYFVINNFFVIIYTEISENGLRFN